MEVTMLEYKDQIVLAVVLVVDPGQVMEAPELVDLAV